MEGIRQKISYLKDLGITAVWMTPIYKQVPLFTDRDGSVNAGYHGYWADWTYPLTMETEPKFGNRDVVREVIDELHQNNLAVIFDMIINHCGYGAEVVTIKPGWFRTEYDCDIDANPLNCPLAGLPDFKQKIPEVQEYLTNLSLEWVKAFKMDGIRMDTARHVPRWYLNKWNNAVRSVRPNCFTIAEVWNDDINSFPTQIKLYFENGFDSAFNFPLRKAIVECVGKGESVDKIAHVVKDTIAKLSLKQALLLINFLDNHDTTRFINEPGIGVPETEIMRRQQLALGLLFTLPGIPQIYYGTEIGMYGRKDPDNRFDMPYWAWTDSERVKASKRYRLTPTRFLPEPKVVFEHTKKLIEIRKQNEALKHGSYTELWRQNGAPNPNVLSFVRATEDTVIIVIMNNGPAPSGDMEIPIKKNTNLPDSARKLLHEGAELKDLLDEGAPDILRISQGSLAVKIYPKTLGIYRLKR